MRYLTVPNIITAIRLVLFFPFIYFLFKLSLTPTLIIYAIARLTDGLDGYLARRLNQSTFEGRVFDTLVDFLFFIAIIIFAIDNSYIGISMLATYLFAGLFFIVAYLRDYHLHKKFRPLKDKIDIFAGAANEILFFLLLIRSDLLILVYLCITLIVIKNMVQGTLFYLGKY